MQKISKFLTPSLIFVSIFLMLIMPVLSFAQDATPTPTPTPTPAPKTGLVPCTNTPDPVTGIISKNSKCDFDQLMALVNKVIDFILKDMVIPIAAIMFAYAGFLLVTAGGESAGAKTKAKSILMNTVIGLIIALAAWLIIKLILTTVGFNTSLF